MLKKMSTMFVFVLLLSVVAQAQWDFQGAWPDTNYKGGTHGIAVSPDGNVWTASYYSTDWITPDGDTLRTSPILVFSADGSSVDTIQTVATNGGFTVDTLSGSCRGLSADADGNILYVQSGPSKILKIDYQTMEGMARHDITEVGSSPTRAAASSDGSIFVGPVVGGGTSAIVKYDTDLNFVENAVVGPPAISRTMEVSNDGNSIYWTPFTGTFGVYLYSRADEFSPYELTDSLVQGMSVETVALNPATGLLWVSNDSRGDSIYSHLTWYGMDLTTKTLVDSFTLPSPDPTPADEYPRGLAFTPDGGTAFVGLFGSKYSRLYKFDKSTGVEQEMGIVPDKFDLSQNYPNPFNPSTVISFNVAKAGFVTLKVYDITGKEVATLVNSELTNGKFYVNFDASNLASGTYIYQLTSNGTKLSKKMMLLK